MKIVNCVQGSEEWYAIRCGKATASHFDSILQMDGKLSKQREKYLYSLVAEMITGQKVNGYQVKAMTRGMELEAEARETYEFMTGENVQRVGFCMDNNETHGASPDGLVGKNGVVEIKCPEAHTHIGYILKGVFPSTYFQQVQGQLFVTDRKWCDFMSYYPGLKPFVIRVEKDVDFQKHLFGALSCFCEELEMIKEKII